MCNIMCVVDVDVDVDGLNRVITDRDTRLINGCGPPPENVRSWGRNVPRVLDRRTIRGGKLIEGFH